MKKLLAFCFLIVTSQYYAQEKFTISGTISDSTRGEALINATVKVKGMNLGAHSNEYGFYSLTLPVGNYTLIVLAVGFETQEYSISLDKNIQKNHQLIALADKVKEIKEINVSGRKQDQNVSDPVMGVERLNPAEVAKIPVLLGEKDIIKTMQLLPGVKSAGEGNAGFYVRGGGSDQNLILLDEAPVYNAAHLLGFFSTFNSDAIKDALLYKGNQPANYGGRLSSVLDIKMNDEYSSSQS